MATAMVARQPVVERAPIFMDRLSQRDRRIETFQFVMAVTLKDGGERVKANGDPTAPDQATDQYESRFLAKY
jgi:hypothetical protein